MHFGFILDFALDLSGINLLHTNLSNADLDSLRYRYKFFKTSSRCFGDQQVFFWLQTLQMGHKIITTQIAERILPGRYRYC